MRYIAGFDKLNRQGVVVSDRMWGFHTDGERGDTHSHIFQLIEVNWKEGVGKYHRMIVYLYIREKTSYLKFFDGDGNWIHGVELWPWMINDETTFVTAIGHTLTNMIDNGIV
jgi:hypothetical protein